MAFSRSSFSCLTGGTCIIRRIWTFFSVSNVVRPPKLTVTCLSVTGGSCLNARRSLTVGPEGRMRLENDVGMGQSPVSFARLSWSIGMMGGVRAVSRRRYGK